MGIKKTSFLKFHSDSERNNESDDSKHEVAVNYSEINKLKLYTQVQGPDPRGPLALFQRRKTIENQGRNRSYSGLKIRVAYALLVDKINGSPLDTLQLKFHLNQEQAHTKSNQTKLQNIFRWHFNQRFGNHDLDDDDNDDIWSIESTDQCCFISRRKKNSALNLRCLLSCHQLHRSKSYRIKTQSKNPTKKLRDKIISSNLLLREKDKVSSTLDDKFVNFDTINTRDVISNDKNKVDDTYVHAYRSNKENSSKITKKLASTLSHHHVASTKTLAPTLDPGHVSKNSEKQNLTASTKIKLPKISSQQRPWTDLDNGENKVGAIPVYDDRKQIMAKKTTSKGGNGDTKPTKSDSKKGNFFNFAKFSTAVNCFSPDIIRDSKVPPGNYNFVLK